MHLNYSLNIKRLFPVVLFCLLATINSCKKTNFVDETITADPAINDAKLWYEILYPKLVTANIKATATQGVGGKPDFSQLFKPNWQHSITYKRFGANVIETPVVLTTSFKYNLRSDVKDYDPAYTKTSFLIMKTDSTRSAFLMMIIADSAYINNDTTKLSKNSYRKRDDIFSGRVIYFTPKGQFISTFAYKNGSLVKPVTPVAQPQKTAKLQVNAGIEHESASCTHYYWIMRYVDDRSIASMTYLFTICEGGGGVGSGGGGGTGSGPPTPCPGTQSVVNKITVNALGDEEYDDGTGGGGGGFPPPGSPRPTEGSPCEVNPVNQIITNNLTNDCLRGMVDIIIAKGLKTKINGLIQDVFGGTSQPLLTFEDSSLLPNGLPTNEAGQTDGLWHSAAFGGGLMSAKVYLNVNTLPGSSKEYIAATIIHEVIHAYLDKNGISTTNHDAMASAYFSLMTSSLMELFPGMTESDAKALTWGGLEKTLGYTTNVVDTGLKSTYNTKNSSYKYKESGTGCN